jgi:hypothetical protein
MNHIDGEITTTNNFIVLCSAEESGEKEAFEFTIEPFITGGFVLYIRYIPGAGVWQTVEKAKQVAEETATGLLNGAIISWKSQSGSKEPDM